MSKDSESKNVKRLKELAKQKDNSQQSSTTKGLRKGWTRATFIVRQAHIEKARDIAYWERKTMMEVIAEALENYVSEKKVQPRPKKTKIYEE